jgi:hypothetical protein
MKPGFYIVGTGLCWQAGRTLLNTFFRFFSTIGNGFTNFKEIAKLRYDFVLNINQRAVKT